MNDRATSGGGSQGPSIDRAGVSVIDPTPNVKELSEASNRRQDDLRAKDKEISDIKHNHQAEMAALRAECAHEIRILTDERLEKVRQVDQFTANLNAERALSATQALAAQGSVTAETLRSTVATTASALAKQFEATVNPIVERVAALEKSSYTGQGRQMYSDPMMAEMVAEMKRVTSALAAGSGRTEATKDYSGYIFAAIGALGVIAGIIFAVSK